MVYFIQNDPTIPGEIQKRSATMGLAKDEFTDNGNFPPTIVTLGRQEGLWGDYVVYSNESSITIGNS